MPTLIFKGSLTVSGSKRERRIGNGEQELHMVGAVLPPDDGYH